LGHEPKLQDRALAAGRGVRDVKMHPNYHGRRLIWGRKLLMWLSLMVMLVGWVDAGDARAEDLKSASAHLADQSFALLGRLGKQGSDNLNPLLGVVASFAGDADSLRQSLARGDLRTASSNIASLQADGAAVDRALKIHPNAISAEGWKALTRQVDTLAREIPPCGLHCGAAADEVRGPNVASIVTTSDATESPRIVIASREYGGGILHLKGYFEGITLKSAGIYEGAKRLKAFRVDGVPGLQRVEFDLHLENPSPTTVLRVEDVDNRTGEAAIIDPSLEAPAASEISEGTTPSAAFSEEGAALPKLGEEPEIAEIPSHGPLLPSPSKRHTLVSKLGDVRIDILSVLQTSNLPPTYEIVGQISGRGITRAGIYLNGRLLQPIPIIDSASYTSFDQHIVAGRGATTIRAYSIGNQFIEQPVDLLDADDTSEPRDYADRGLVESVPMGAAGIAVQITAVRPTSGNLCLVNGIISGSDVASAGLYQNGVLAQNIGVATGLAGALRALLPGDSRSINFSVRFNPYAGPATIRAFNSTGAFTEQPLFVAGISPSGAPFPNSPYSGAGNFPSGGSFPTSRFPNTLGSTRPLW
jgi:hypothetical protein